jgi:hypothetical protein
MSRAIRTASILHNESAIQGSEYFGKRVKLILRHYIFGDYRWYTEHGEDTEVSGKYASTACDAAKRAWGQTHVWDLRATWI